MATMFLQGFMEISPDASTNLSTESVPEVLNPNLVVDFEANPVPDDSSSELINARGADSFLTRLHGVTL